MVGDSLMEPECQEELPASRASGTRADNFRHLGIFAEFVDETLYRNPEKLSSRASFHLYIRKGGGVCH